MGQILGASEVVFVIALVTAVFLCLGGTPGDDEAEDE